MSEASALTLQSAQHGPGKRLPESTRHAIVARFTVNGSILQTANEFGVHRNTVQRLVNSVRNVPNSPLNAVEWKAETKARAISAVNAGLDCKDDPYKRGELGNKVLVGLGEFKGQDVNIGVNIANCPPELMARLIETPTDEPQ